MEKPKSENALYILPTVKQSEEIESQEVSAIIGKPDEDSTFKQKKNKITLMQFKILWKLFFHYFRPIKILLRVGIR